LCESIRRKGQEKLFDGNWILHHDNAPTHTSHLVKQFLAKNGTALLQQPPYSPDLTPRHFSLFTRLKKFLNGHQFKATEDIKRNSTKTLLDSLKNDFAKCFQEWQKLWAMCATAGGTMLKKIRVKTP
jgi:transposase